MSLQSKRGFVADERRCEVGAIAVVAGVGGHREWWKWNLDGLQVPSCGHLRVPTTPEEQRLIPPGLVEADAGDEGILRPRTYL